MIDLLHLLVNSFISLSSLVSRAARSLPRKLLGKLPLRLVCVAVDRLFSVVGDLASLQRHLFLYSSSLLGRRMCPSGGTGCVWNAGPSAAGGMARLRTPRQRLKLQRRRTTE